MKRQTTNSRAIRIFRSIGLCVAICLLFGAAVAEAREGTFKLSKRGEDSAFLKVQPWSGYWWSRREGKLVNGWQGHPESPMKKYDRYAESRTGKNPGAQAWEANPRNGHYDPKGPGWAGHCNGWAAASMLEPEPRQSRTLGAIEFTVADQKALLSEMYMDCHSLFYGKRKNNNVPFSLDIKPNLFHRLLIENIKQKQRAMVADTSFNAPVWNYPISGYETEWKPTLFMPWLLRVTTTVHFVDDGVKPEFVGTKTFTKTYHYILIVGSNGEVTDGYWDPRSLWDHPDFVWIPTSDMPSQGGENPRLSPALVHEITGTSPAAGTVAANVTQPEMCLSEAGVDSTTYFAN